MSSIPVGNGPVPRGTTQVLRVPEDGGFRFMAVSELPEKTTTGENLARPLPTPEPPCPARKSRKRLCPAGLDPRAIVDRLGRKMTVCVRLVPDAEDAADTTATHSPSGDAQPRRTR